MDLVLPTSPTITFPNRCINAWLVSCAMSAMIFCMSDIGDVTRAGDGSGGIVHRDVLNHGEVRSVYARAPFDFFRGIAAARWIDERRDGCESQAPPSVLIPPARASAQACAQQGGGARPSPDAGGGCLSQPKASFCNEDIDVRHVGTMVKTCSMWGLDVLWI